MINLYKVYDHDDMDYYPAKYMPKMKACGLGYEVCYWYYLQGKPEDIFDDVGDERETSEINIVKDKNGQEKITKQFDATTRKWHFVFTLEMRWPTYDSACNLQFFHEVSSCTEANDVRMMCSEGRERRCYRELSALNLAETVYRQIRFHGNVEVNDVL